MKPETVINPEHLRLRSKAQAMLERARCSPMLTATSYTQYAKGVTVSITLIKRQNCVSVHIIGDYVLAPSSKCKISNKVHLFEGTKLLADTIRKELRYASSLYKLTVECGTSTGSSIPFKNPPSSSN